MLIFFLITRNSLSAPAGGQKKVGEVDVRTQIIGVNKTSFLYLPATMDPNRLYWLVCYVHGAHGAGREDVESLKDFVNRGDCIGVAPSFNEGYQLLEHGADKQLMDIFQQLRGRYKLHTKLLVFGHSAGGQFAHRFMLRHPELVIGCEACSSGTWATGGIYHHLTSKAQKIPIAIACGSRDKTKIGSVMERLSAQYSHHTMETSHNPGWNRIEWFHKFVRQLQEGDFFFKEKVISGASHHIQESEQEQLAIEVFLLGTSGMLPEERVWYDQTIAMIEKDSANKQSYLVKQGLQQLQQKVMSRSQVSLQKTLTNHGWHANEKALACCIKAARNFVDQEIMRLAKSN